jgi:hypothetical protein
MRRGRVPTASRVALVITLVGAAALAFVLAKQMSQIGYAGVDYLVWVQDVPAAVRVEDVTAAVARASSGSGADIAKDVVDPRSPVDIRHLYLQPTHATPRGWLEAQRYPDFSRDVTTLVHPLEELPAGAVRGYYNVYGPASAAESLATELRELGVGVVEASYPSLLWLIEGAIPSEIAVATSLAANQYAMTLGDLADPGSSVDVVNPLVLVLPTQGRVLTDDMWSAYATTAGVYFIDSSLAEQATSDAELGDYVLALNPVGQNAAVQLRELTEAQSLNVVSLLVAGGVVMMSGLAVGLIYCRRFQQAIFSKHTLGWTFLMTHKWIVAIEEQQRLAIARLIVKQPSVILADEPTAALDPENAERVMSLLHEFTRDGCILIVATHNAELAARCSEALQLGCVATAREDLERARV